MEEFCLFSRLAFSASALSTIPFSTGGFFLNYFLNNFGITAFIDGKNGYWDGWWERSAKIGGLCQAP